MVQNNLPQECLRENIGRRGGKARPLGSSSLNVSSVRRPERQLEGSPSRPGYRACVPRHVAATSLQKREIAVRHRLYPLTRAVEDPTGARPFKSQVCSNCKIDPEDDWNEATVHQAVGLVPQYDLLQEPETER